MPDKTYRVVQWTTGNLGKIAIRHFAENPDFELAGVLVTDPAKVGRDAGEIAGIGSMGIVATDDVEAIIALDADCVHFTPLVLDVDMICRLLRSGKNVVSACGPFFPWGPAKLQLEAIAQACNEGRSSFHGSGIHPGYAGDLLVMTGIRLMERIDRIESEYVIDYMENPANYVEFWGFGSDPDELRKWANQGHANSYAESMEQVARCLGLTVTHVTDRFEVATATCDIHHPRGVIRAGTVAAQHFQCTGWVENEPFITFHRFITMGKVDIDPPWKFRDNGYHVRIHGNPPMEMSVTDQQDAAGVRRYHGLAWTAMAGINVIPAVCEASPGVVTHFDLGIPKMPRGLALRTTAR